MQRNSLDIEEIKTETEETTSVSGNDIFNKTSHSSFGQLLSILLAMGNSAAITNLLAFLAFFGKLAERLPFLPVFPLVGEILTYALHLRKLIVKPVEKLPIPIKIVLGLLMSTVFLLNGTALTFSVLAGFLGHAVPVFIKIASLGPIFFTVGLGVASTLSWMKFAQIAHDYRTKEWMRTKQNELKIMQRGLTAIALTTMTALIIPFFIAIGGFSLPLLVNPFTAGPTAAILFGLLVGAATVIVAAKIVKTVAEHREQERSAKNMVEQAIDPYRLLKLDQHNLKHLSNKKINAAIFLAYKAKENSLVEQMHAAKTKEDKENCLKQLRACYSAYEMLGNSRSRDMYHTFTLIKNGQASSSPEKTLGISHSLLRFSVFRPLLWLNYKLNRLGKDEKTQQDLDVAYKIHTHAALRDYQKETTAPKPGPAKQSTWAWLRTPLFGSHQSSQPVSIITKEQSQSSSPRSSTPSSPSSPLWGKRTEKVVVKEATAEEKIAHQKFGSP